MSVSYLPTFLQEPYLNLQKQDLPEQEQARLISSIWEMAVSFWGKLLVLEYLQAGAKSAHLNYRLMRSPYPKSPSDWLGWIQEIFAYFVQDKSTPVLYPLLHFYKKYPSLHGTSEKNPEENEDRLSSLAWFYELGKCGNYLLTKADIEESQEFLEKFLEDFSFLESVQYKLEQNHTSMLFENNTLALHPFFLAHMGNEGMILDNQEEGIEALEKLYQRWIPQEFQQYLKHKLGEISYGTVLKQHQEKYVLPPWLELNLEEMVDKIFTNIHTLDASNIFLVEGHPGTGKTALAANLSKLFATWGKILNYFIIPDTPTQEHATLAQWLWRNLEALVGSAETESPANVENNKYVLLQEKFTQLSPKIMVVIDGLENMPVQEYKKTAAMLQENPWRHILFVLLQRCHEAPAVDTPYRICLQKKDNPYFDTIFTPGYLGSLRERYLTATYAEKILHFFIHNPGQFFSVVELAEYLDGFTPDILKAILKMKPLCELIHTTQTKDQGGEMFPVDKYRLFDSVCEKLIA